MWRGWGGTYTLERPAPFYTVLCSSTVLIVRDSELNMKVLMRADTHQNIQLPVDSGNKPNFTFSQVRSYNLLMKKLLNKVISLL